MLDMLGVLYNRHEAVAKQDTLSYMRVYVHIWYCTGNHRSSRHGVVLHQAYLLDTRTKHLDIAAILCYF